MAPPVLGPYTRQFRLIFEEAQLQLRSVFGMEMSALPLKEKITISQRRGKSQHAVSGLLSPPPVTHDCM